MPVAVTIAQVKQLAPNPIPEYEQAFASGQAVLDAANITDNPLRVAHFMAQVIHESARLTSKSENLTYTTAERIQAVFGKRRFPTLADAQACVRNPEALANKAYAGMLGNTAPGDGWKYRGRGMIQITGKANYKEFGDAAGLDLVADPDLAFSADAALKVACAFWNAKKCSESADQDDIVAVTLKINGGKNGLPDREALLAAAKAIWS